MNDPHRTILTESVDAAHAQEPQAAEPSRRPSAQRPRLLLSLALLLALLPVAGVRSLAHQRHRTAQERTRTVLLTIKRQAAWDALQRDLREEIARFGGEVGLVVEDFRTGWRFAYQADHRIAAASLIKVPIMVACLEAEARGKVNLSEPLTLRGADKVLGTGILKASPNGTTWTIRQLLELSITRSDNTATNLLIERMGLASFDARFAKLGLKDTNLSRRMMDFSHRRQGVENYTSAEDIALLLSRTYRQKGVAQSTAVQGLEFLKQQRLRDRIPKKLPEGIVVAHKTGLERYVCHDAGIVFSPQGDFAITVLTKSRHRTAAPAKALIARLALRVYTYVAGT